MRSFSRVGAGFATVLASLAVATPAVADPSPKAGCIAHLVSFMQDETEGPYGAFISEHAQADRPFGQGVSLIATECG